MRCVVGLESMGNGFNAKEIYMFHKLPFLVIFLPICVFGHHS